MAGHVNVTYTNSDPVYNKVAKMSSPNNRDTCKAVPDENGKISISDVRANCILTRSVRLLAIIQKENLHYFLYVLNLIEVRKNFTWKSRSLFRDVAIFNCYNKRTHKPRANLLRLDLNLRFQHKEKTWCNHSFIHLNQITSLLTNRGENEKCGLQIYELNWFRPESFVN